jgi:competence protein ComEC
MTLIYLTIAWSLGILLARALGPTSSWLIGLSLAGLGGLMAACLRRRGRLAAALAIAILAGGWRYAFSQPLFDASMLPTYNDSGAITVWGYVSADPTVHATYTQLEISAQWLDAGAGPRPVRGKLVLNAPLYPTHAYGDRLRLEGPLETPPILDTFPYREYLASRGVYSLMRRAQVTPLPGKGGSWLLRGIYRIKAALKGAIERILPNPEAGLLAGIVLGLGHTLPDELLEAFRLAGLTHIIVISGFNIGLVAQAVMVLSQRWAHRWATLCGSLGAVVLFVLLVGPSPPVMRAAWMGGLAILAQLAGRRSHALTALAASCLIMTAGNPLLLWSVSFQLSFVTTLSLILLEPALARRLHDWAAGNAGDDDARRRWFGLARDVLVGTMAAQLATLPLIWAHFGQISLLSLLTNLLVLPLQPAIMALGVLAIGGGLLWLPLGRVLGWLAWPLLHFTIWVARLCARVPWAGLAVAPPPLPVIWALYAVLLLFAWRSARTRRDQESADPRTPRRVVWIALLLLLVTTAAWEVGASLPDGRLHLYVLDVGQGDAVLLRTPQGRVILVDGGPDPLLLTSRLGQFLPFWRREIDLVVATHADGDHLSGLIPVLERYRVRRVLESPTMSANALVDAWRQATDQAQLQPAVAVRGMRVTMGTDGAIEVLHPPADRGGPTRSDNAQSVALRVTMGRFRVLLTADVDADVEREWLAAQLPVQATILKVAHHGARSATSDAFVAAVNPQVAVISVGAENRFGHPSQDVLQRLEMAGALVLRTDELGTVELITDGERLWVKTHGTKR